MKRAHAPRRRDRRSGMSPYQRHAKAPFRYSAAYYEWFKSIAKKVAKSAEETR